MNSSFERIKRAYDDRQKEKSASQGAKEIYENILAQFHRDKNKFSQTKKFYALDRIADRITYTGITSREDYREDDVHSIVFVGVAKKDVENWLFRSPPKVTIQIEAGSFQQGSLGYERYELNHDGIVFYRDANGVHCQLGSEDYSTHLPAMQAAVRAVLK